MNVSDFFAHPLVVASVLWLSGAALTSVLRFRESQDYDAWAAKHPRLATALKIARALLPYVPQAVQAVRDLRAGKVAPAATDLEDLDPDAAGAPPVTAPNLIVSYWAGKIDAPGWTVLERAATKGQPPPLPPHRRLALFGYSLGCMDVRAHLLAGVKPDAVGCIDGISETWPVMTESRLAMWRRLADEARRGERVFLITHTRQTYTEGLAVKPYASTLTTARAITGWQLDLPADVQREGKLMVWSAPSKDTDKAAHEHQARVVAPAAMKAVIDILDADTDRELGASRSPPGTPLGLRALEHGLRFLGTREVAGSRADATISAWLARCERGGRRLGLASDEVAWCAAFASACAYDAAGPGERPPHGYRAAVAELWADALKAGAAREPGWGPEPGDLAIFRRAGGDPRTGGTGHVARVVEPPALGADGRWHFRTLDGNHGNAVQLVDRIVDADLVGWVAYPRNVASMLPETAARLTALVRAVESGEYGRAALEKLVETEPPSAA